MKNKQKKNWNKTIKVVKRCLNIFEESDKGCLARDVAKNVLNTAYELLTVWITSQLIDMVVSGEPWRDIMIFVLTTAAVTHGLSFAATTIDRRHNCHSFASVSYDNRVLWEKIINMDYVHIENPETHIALQRMRQGFGRMNRVAYGIYSCITGLISIIASAVMILPLALRGVPGATGFMGFVSSPWGLVSLVGAVAVIEVGRGLITSKITYKYFSNAMNDRKKIQGERTSSHYIDSTLQRYQNGKDVRIFDERELIMREYESSAMDTVDVWHDVLRKMWGSDSVTALMSLLTNLIMYGFAALRAVSGALSVGEIIGFVMYFSRITGGIGTLTDGIGSISVDVDFLDDAFKFLDIPDEKYKGTLPTEKRDDDEYEFEFKNVWFKYPNSEQYVLRGVNLKWRIGEKMALVGKNGCGKSTLVKLLCRLYDPTEGEITLNGIDIRKYRYEEYMALFSVVFQDSGLFSFSVAENIACCPRKGDIVPPSWGNGGNIHVAAADTGYDPDKVRDCVERAGLGERISRMENGIETCLYKDFDENGVEISGGEAQKLCLARAIYKGAPFIVLDEPTASLDPISEHDIYTKFNGIVGTKTAVYISHRLSSCRFCDEITVMENGAIAERGTHDELIARGGVYGKLWAAQAEYYKDTAGDLYM